MAERVIVELTREQAQAVMSATELLARLEIGQFREITWQFLDKFSKNGRFDHVRRDRADDLLEEACRLIFGAKAGFIDISEKSITHERCWAVYSTIRHALSWHDHPEGGITVNFDPPMGYGEPMPVCRVEEEGE